eukprot:CAMPEP_0185173850 /NCGR_PEP_ID=MMETSP1139-20130426/24148_1 /TAXON_ID=298111 /ORGANISM="Pavlova sp., Strain CCMP459" /LENGTH=516 /DNA_ID=CAMNT_0027739555 /DNA_START=21 /DNA_END=1574 /DNA_ORIENTATION=+
MEDRPSRKLAAAVLGLLAGVGLIVSVVHASRRVAPGDESDEAGAEAKKSHRIEWPNRSFFNATCAKDKLVTECPGYRECWLAVNDFNETKMVLKRSKLRWKELAVRPERKWCDRWACLDLRKCELPFKIYQYTKEDLQGLPIRRCLYHAYLERDPYVAEHLTDDPKRACMFFFKIPKGCRFHDGDIETLPYGNGTGINHIFVDYYLEGIDADTRERFLGHAAIAQGHTGDDRFIHGLDIGIGHYGKFPPQRNDDALRATPPWERKYLVTFKGTASDVSRKVAGFHNNPRRRAIFLVKPHPRNCNAQTSVSRPYGDNKRKPFGPFHADCCRTLRPLYNSYGYGDLMNTSFALVPPGQQPATYRLAEVMERGCIPVFFGYEHNLLPYEELIDWSAFSLNLPQDIDFENMLYPRLEALLRDRNKVLAMQKAAIDTWRQWFNTTNSFSASYRAIVATLERRFMFQTGRRLAALSESPSPAGGAAMMRYYGDSFAPGWRLRPRAEMFNASMRRRAEHLIYD